MKRHEILELHGSSFHRLFGCNLDLFLHPLFGFDVIAFDEQLIKPPNGTSTRQAILEKQGQEAVDLILHLLHPKP